MIRQPGLTAKARALHLLAALWLLLGFGAAVPAAAAGFGEPFAIGAMAPAADAAYADALGAFAQPDDDRERSGGDDPPAMLAFDTEPSEWRRGSAAPQPVATSLPASRRASPFHARAPPLA